MLTVIAGLCVLEDESVVFEVADEVKRQLAGLPIKLYFKASFDKANRTSIKGFRGPGLEAGLKLLNKVKERTGLQLCTDFHEAEQAKRVAEVVDFLQVPAFLCRQTDMIIAAAEAALTHGRRLNIKKGQFLAPWDARNIVEKVREVQSAHKGAQPDKDWFCLTERGVSFGYNALVVDMSGFQCMQGFGVPVIYDATHSVQIPGAAPGGKSTGGRRENIEVLARAAVAAGADGVFIETHPRPAEARSDGPNALLLQYLGGFVKQLVELHGWVANNPRITS
jgi:2-dehydro-3-deoxyphosphooctonate aldolase (KDO 8-P synthase)